jgi:hypothetical protein
MNGPLSPALTTLATTAPGAGAFLISALTTAALTVVAVIRVVRRPAHEWPHGTWSKIGWVLIILNLVIPLGGFLIPVGAIAALINTRRPQTTPGPAQLPYADSGTLEAK